MTEVLMLYEVLFWVLPAPGPSSSKTNNLPSIQKWMICLLKLQLFKPLPFFSCSFLLSSRKGFKLVILDEADAMTQDAQNALRRGKAICSARRRPLWATRLNEQPDDLAAGVLQGICSYTLVLFLNQSDLKIWSQHEHEWLESVDFMFLLRARPQLQVEYCFQWLQMYNIVTSRIISGWFVLKSSLLSLSFCFLFQWLRSLQKTLDSVWSATICPRSSPPCSLVAPDFVSARCPRTRWSHGWST